MNDTSTLVALSAELQEEFAKKLLMCLKQGRQLILLCSNSNPPITSKFAHPALFPMSADALLDAAKLAQCLGIDANLEDTFLKGSERRSHHAIRHLRPVDHPSVRVRIARMVHRPPWAHA